MCNGRRRISVEMVTALTVEPRPTETETDGISLVEEPKNSAQPAGIAGEAPEALQVKLKHRSNPVLPSPSTDTRREALEVKLRHQEQTPQKKPSPKREALDVKLRHVKSTSKERLSGRSPKQAAEKLVRRASSMLGMKPSQLKKKGTRGKLEQEAPGGVNLIKNVLAKQLAQMAQLEQSLEHDRKEAIKRERKDFLEQHLKARQEKATIEQLREQVQNVE